MGTVVSIEPNKVPASELAQTLVSRFGAQVAKRACAREMFLAGVEGNSEAEQYWTTVESELEPMGAKVPTAETRVDHATADEGLLLNKVFVRIKNPQSRRALIKHAISVLREEPIEDQ